MADQITFSMTWPKELRDRAYAVTERLRMPIAALIRDTVREKVEFLEMKFRTEDEQRRADKNQARDERDRARERRLTKLGMSPLAPKRLEPLARPKDDSDGRHAPTMAERRANEPRFRAIYEGYGRKIAAAVSDRDAVKRLAREALDAVQHAAPLTFPDDEEVLTELERIAIAERERLERESTEIDPTKIRTRGARSGTSE